MNDRKHFDRRVKKDYETIQCRFQPTSHPFIVNWNENLKCVIPDFIIVSDAGGFVFCWSFRSANKGHEKLCDVLESFTCVFMSLHGSFASIFLNKILYL